jgi:hypothetical protein
MDADPARAGSVSVGAKVHRGSPTVVADRNRRPRIYLSETISVREHSMRSFTNVVVLLVNIEDLLKRISSDSPLSTGTDRHRGCSPFRVTDERGWASEWWPDFEQHQPKSEVREGLNSNQRRVL